MDLELDGKVALITGSSSGIGFAIARSLANEGVQVALNGRDEIKIKEAVEQIPNAHGFVADVRMAQNCENLISQVLEKFSRLDILVCNVGSGTSVPPGEENPDEWHRMIELNLSSTTQVVWAAADALKLSQGSIVCITSICAIEALGCPVAYSASKSAVESYVKNISRYFGKSGVRINSVAPGNILHGGSVWNKKMKRDPDGIKKMLIDQVPLQRLGAPEEVADLVTFLSSERASFITGSSVVIDGGQTR